MKYHQKTNLLISEIIKMTSKIMESNQWQEKNVFKIVGSGFEHIPDMI